MGCCESKDDPYNYHFDPPIKSFRESKLTISKDLTLVSLNHSKRHISNSSLDKNNFRTEKKEEIPNKKNKHNRKKSSELILPKLTIDNFTSYRSKKKNKIPFPSSMIHNTTVFNSNNYNQYKYIFEDPLEAKYKSRSKRSNSRSGKHYKNSVTINVSNNEDIVVQDFADLANKAHS